MLLDNTPCKEYLFLVEHVLRDLYQIGRPGGWLLKLTM